MGARRRLLALSLLAASAAAVALKRRAAADRVDVYFDDGSMVSFAAGSPAGDRLLAIARAALR